MQRTRRVKNKNTWLLIWPDSGKIDLNLTFQQCTFEICHWPYTVYGTRSQTLCKTVVFMRFDCGRRADDLRIPNRRLDFARVRNFRITLDMARSRLWLFLFFTQLYASRAEQHGSDGTACATRKRVVRSFCRPSPVAGVHNRTAVSIFGDTSAVVP